MITSLIEGFDESIYSDGRWHDYTFLLTDQTERKESEVTGEINDEAKKC